MAVRAGRQDRQVVITRQFRAGGVHAFDDDDAGPGNVVQFARGQCTGRPVITLIVRGPAGV